MNLFGVITIVLIGFLGSNAFFPPQINDKETELVMVVGEDSKCVLEGGGVLPPPELLAALPLKTGFNSAKFLVQVPQAYHCWRNCLTECIY